MVYVIDFEAAQAIVDSAEGMYWQCTGCGGAGVRRHFGQEDRYVVCYSCHGHGGDGVPQLATLLGQCVATRGARKGCLLKAAPFGPSSDPDKSRARWLWRMLRFHSGLDVCMPWGFDLGSDKGAERVLDSFAKAIVAAVTGKASAGQDRWREAMYGDCPAGDGLEVMFRGSAFNRARLV